MQWRLILILLVFGTSGCSLLAPKPAQEPVTPPPVAEPVTPPAVVVPKPVALPPPPEEVAILVSSDIPAYHEVADAVALRLAPHAKTWYLRGTMEQRLALLEEIFRSDHQQVVAIGLDAAVASKRLSGKQVIFCQVFNYEDDHLLSATMKGVGMLPSFDKTFAALHALSPELKSIAIITGPRLRDLVQSATAAAKSHGIAVIHHEVTSDKEFLLVYKSMANEVDGYWIWPDNRILSGSVMREVMTFSVRSGKQVLVFNDELLALGGLLSATSDHRDIANQVVERLRQSEGKKGIPGSPIEPLDDVTLQINPIMAKRFGLEIPEQYRKYIHGP